jgi:hypothetical protein
MASDYLDKTAALVAICDLIALLMLLISLWFTVQKFFYVKLDAILTSISLIFIIGGLVGACSGMEKSDTNHLFYIIVSFKHLLTLIIQICHLYLFVSQFFSIGWALICTRNSVSRLFIRDWGKGVTLNEIELLERDF